MKIGDLVTWKGRPDLHESPPPWRRMGVITGLGEYSTKSGRRVKRWKVYWFDSTNEVQWVAEELELVNA